MSLREQRVLNIAAGGLVRSILMCYSQHPSRPELSVLLRPNDDSSTPISTSSQSIFDFLDQLKASPVYLDLTAPITDLVTVFQRFESIVSCAGMSAPPGTEERLCTAAIRAQAGRYIPWHCGVNYDEHDDNPIIKVFKESQWVRRMLRSQTRYQVDNHLHWDL